MADNVTINSGAVDFDVATDDIAGKHYQRVKPTWGSDGSAVDVSAANPLPVGGARTGLARATDAFLAVSPLPALNWRCGFDKAVASGVDTAWLSALAVGAGMTVSQSGGNLLLTSGTTLNSETTLRSVVPFTGELTLRYATLLSQRIANQAFFLELVDVIGDALALVVNSATSATVTIPGNPFTASNIGQSVRLTNITLANCYSAQYPITAVSGNDVTFGVSGWPASGSGTLSLSGWNAYYVSYNSASPTVALVDSQRNGYSSGSTSAVINTTAAGHVGVLATSDEEMAYFDQTGTSATGLETTRRASRVRNLPDTDRPLYLQLRVVNGATAPASSTTWTVGFVNVSNFAAMAVSLASVMPMSANTGLPVEVVNSVAISGTVPVSGTLTANVANATFLPVTPTTTFVNSAASTNAVNVKNSAATLWSVVASNINAAARYLKIYNKASAPTVGTDIPVLTIALPPSDTPALVQGGANGMRLGTGLAFAITAGAADSDTTAVAAGDVKVVVTFS